MRRVTLAAALAVTLALVVGEAALGVQAVRHHGSAHLNAAWGVDFDKGVVEQAHFSGEDLWTFGVTSSERSLKLAGSARIRKMGSSRPSYSTCSTASLLQIDYKVMNVTLGTWFCFKTGSGRFVRFRLTAAQVSPYGIDMVYTTWEH